jgi:hypothetical protein
MGFLSAIVSAVVRRWLPVEKSMDTPDHEAHLVADPWCGAAVLCCEFHEAQSFHVGGPRVVVSVEDQSMDRLQRDYIQERLSLRPMPGPRR